MKNLQIAVWAVLVFVLAWLAYDSSQPKPADNCQRYDSLGRGIGCEGKDIGDL
jgi:hypothetical protein